MVWKGIHLPARTTRYGARRAGPPRLVACGSVACLALASRHSRPLITPAALAESRSTVSKSAIECCIQNAMIQPTPAPVAISALTTIVPLTIVAMAAVGFTSRRSGRRKAIWRMLWTAYLGGLIAVTFFPFVVTFDPL